MSAPSASQKWLEKRYRGSIEELYHPLMIHTIKVLHRSRIPSLYSHTASRVFCKSLFKKKKRRFIHGSIPLLVGGGDRSISSSSSLTAVGEGTERSTSLSTSGAGSGIPTTISSSSSVGGTRGGYRRK